MGWELPTWDEVTGAAAQATGTGAGSRWGQRPGELLESYINLFTDYFTVGYGGFKNGHVTRGNGEGYGTFVGHGFNEGLGDVTGRNATRKQIMIGQDAINEEKANKTQQLKDELIRKQRQDTSASQMAGSLQAQAAAQRQQSLGTSGNPHSDFLGL